MFAASSPPLNVRRYRRRGGRKVFTAVKSRSKQDEEKGEEEEGLMEEEGEKNEEEVGRQRLLSLSIGPNQDRLSSSNAVKQINCEDQPRQSAAVFSDSLKKPVARPTKRAGIRVVVPCARSRPKVVGQTLIWSRRLLRDASSDCLTIYRKQLEVEEPAEEEREGDQDTEKEEGEKRVEEHLKELDEKRSLRRQEFDASSAIVIKSCNTTKSSTNRLSSISSTTFSPVSSELGRKKSPRPRPTLIISSRLHALPLNKDIVSSPRGHRKRRILNRRSEEVILLPRIREDVVLAQSKIAVNSFHCGREHRTSSNKSTLDKMSGHSVSAQSVLAAQSRDSCSVSLLDSMHKQFCPSQYVQWTRVKIEQKKNDNEELLSQITYASKHLNVEIIPEVASNWSGAEDGVLSDWSRDNDDLQLNELVIWEKDVSLSPTWAPRRRCMHIPEICRSPKTDQEEVFCSKMVTSTSSSSSSSSSSSPLQRPCRLCSLLGKDDIKEIDEEMKGKGRTETRTTAAGK